MRSLVLLALSAILLCSSPASAAEQMPGGIWLKDAPQAWQTAQATGKPLVIFVSMDGCPHCHKMAGTTFTDQALQQTLTSSFVPLYIKWETDAALVKELGVKTFPTTVVVAPDTTVLAEAKGFHAASKLRSTLQEVRVELARTASRSTDTKQ